MRSSTFRIPSEVLLCQKDIEKILMKSSTFRMPSGDLRDSGGLRDSENLQKVFLDSGDLQEVFMFRTPLVGILRSENLQEVLQIQNTFKRPSFSEILQKVFYFSVLQVFYSQKSIFRSFSGGVLPLEVLQGGFYFQKSFKKIFGMSSTFKRSSGHRLSIYRKESFPTQKKVWWSFPLIRSSKYFHHIKDWQKVVSALKTFQTLLTSRTPPAFVTNN